MAAAAFFSAVVVAVLGVLIWLQASANQQSVTVFVLRHAVTAGSPYVDADVSAVSIRASAGDFNYEQRSPDAYAARYAQNLAANDIVRGDDLVDRDAQVEVAISVVAPPPLSAGDHVDVFATVGGGRQARVGRGLPVLAAAGDALTILVPAQQEGAWVSVASAAVPLHVVLANAGAGPDVAPLSAADAVDQLCGSACTAPTP
ncbi:MAG: hypothetical protein ACYDAC_08300 [Candidatus Dormibacteria bacterium]